MKKLALVLLMVSVCVCLTGCAVAAIPIFGGLIAGAVLLPKIIALIKTLLVLIVVIFAIWFFFLRKKGD